MIENASTYIDDLHPRWASWRDCTGVWDFARVNAWALGVDGVEPIVRGSVPVLCPDATDVRFHDSAAEAQTQVSLATEAAARRTADDLYARRWLAAIEDPDGTDPELVAAVLHATEDEAEHRAREESWVALGQPR